MRDLSKYSWLVDRCTGTKYFVHEISAKRFFYNDPLAHTLAKKIDSIWYPVAEIPSQELNPN